MNKICLITHSADPDGAFPIILSRLVFENVDDFSCEVREVDQTLTDVLESNVEYDTIYITDLNITEEMAIKIDCDETLREKIKIFDHHASSEFLNKYSFENVVVEENGRKECGATLFYKHVKEITSNPILERESLKTMIELIREMDTFDFLEENKQLALNFGNLYGIYGRERFIEHFTDFIKENSEFKLSEIEKQLIEIEEERIKRYIEEKLERVKKATIGGIRVGISFAESNRSTLGHAIAERMQDEVDIAVVINVDKSVSYRAEKDEVDVSVLAVPNGGGGHKHASGSPLPKDLQEKIVELIFNDVKWSKED